MERLVSRTRSLRSNQSLNYERLWYMPNQGKAYTLEPAQHNISAMSLVKNKAVYTGSSSTKIDDALQLAAPLLTGPDSLAVTGAWAAPESLLSSTSDVSERGPGRA